MDRLIPENAVVGAQLHASIAGKTISKAHLGQGKSYARATETGFLRITPQQFTNRLTGKKVRCAYGKGKWLFVEVVPNNLVLLLGESYGWLRFYRSQEDVLKDIDPLGQDYMSLQFGDDSCLVNRPQAWSQMKVIPITKLPETNYPNILGISPHDRKEFTYAAFCAALDRFPTKKTRDVLIDQRQISGLNNPYLHDIFFRARVHPKSKVQTLTATQRGDLHRSVLSVIIKAIKLGGREKECDLLGVSGKFRPEIVKSMVGKPCPRCGTAIARDKLVSAQLFLCPKCQELKK